MSSLPPLPSSTLLLPQKRRHRCLRLRPRLAFLPLSLSLSLKTWLRVARAQRRSSTARGDGGTTAPPGLRRNAACRPRRRSSLVTAWQEWAPSFAAGPDASQRGLPPPFRVSSSPRRNPRCLCSTTLAACDVFLFGGGSARRPALAIRHPSTQGSATAAEAPALHRNPAMRYKSTYVVHTMRTHCRLSSWIYHSHRTVD